MSSSHNIVIQQLRKPMNQSFYIKDHRIIVSEDYAVPGSVVLMPKQHMAYMTPSASIERPSPYLSREEKSLLTHKATLFHNQTYDVVIVDLKIGEEVTRITNIKSFSQLPNGNLVCYFERNPWGNIQNMMGLYPINKLLTTPVVSEMKEDIGTLTATSKNTWISSASITESNRQTTIWQHAGNRLVQKSFSHSYLVNAQFIFRNKNLIGLIDSKNWLHVINRMNGNEILTHHLGNHATITAIDLGHDRVIIAADNELSLWEMQFLQIKKFTFPFFINCIDTIQFNKYHITRMILLPNGSIATSHHGGFINFYKIKNNKIHLESLMAVTHPSNSITSLNALNNGQLGYSYVKDGILQMGALTIPNIKKIKKNPYPKLTYEQIEQLSHILNITQKSIENAIQGKSKPSAIFKLKFFESLRLVAPQQMGSHLCITHKTRPCSLSLQ